MPVAFLAPAQRFLGRDPARDVDAELEEGGVRILALQGPAGRNHDRAAIAADLLDLPFPMVRGLQRLEHRGQFPGRAGF